MLKQLFLPVGLLLAVLTAVCCPGPGVFFTANSAITILVVIIFVVSGYQTGSGALELNGKVMLLLTVAGLVSLIIAPLLSLGFTLIFPVPMFLVIGLIVVTTVPPTLSSGVVITRLSGGNGALALLLTMSLNVAGIFTIPFILHLCLQQVGHIDIDAMKLLVKMILLVLLPFVAGKIIRNWRGLATVSGNWSYVNSGCVITTVYCTFANNLQSLANLEWDGYLLSLVAVATVHIALLCINALAGKILKLKAADSKALLFVCSQKTLPISIAILASLPFDTEGAVVVCLLFHFFQLFLDSFLASVVRGRAELKKA